MEGGGDPVHAEGEVAPVTVASGRSRRAHSFAQRGTSRSPSRDQVGVAWAGAVRLSTKRVQSPGPAHGPHFPALPTSTKEPIATIRL